MKIASSVSRIEYLDSKHIDKGTQNVTPHAKPWQRATARLVFNTIGRVFPNFMAKKAYTIFSTPRLRAKHYKPDDIILAAKIIDFPFLGQTIKLYEWANEASDKIILLAHGWESRGTALRMYIQPLLQKGFKVVAFDAFAHGDSDGKINNLLTNARTIAAIYAYYGRIYGAIAHSFGCSSLIYAQQFVDNNIHFERLAFIAIPNRTSEIMKHFFSYMKIPSVVQNAVFEHIQTITNQHVDSSDVALAYPSVKVEKLLLIHDEHDPVTSINAAKRVLEHWNNAHLLVTKGYGHFRIAKNPDVIRKIMAFIVL